MKTQKEDAWSETVYAILILVVTVVLASFFASSVFGTWVQPLQHTKIIATSADQTGNNIYVHYFGGMNDRDLSYLVVIAPNRTPFLTVTAQGALNVTGIPVKPDIGSIMTLSGAATPGNDHIEVVGYFRDQTVQVLLDTFV